MPKSSAGLGATLAESHMAAVYRAVADGTMPVGTLVILDFAKIEAVNSSYIKGTAFWLLTCGQLSSENTESIISPHHVADSRPYDLFVCVTGLSPDLVTEFQEFLKPRLLPLLFARKIAGGMIQEALLLGHLDPTLRFTLNAVTDKGICTAPQLHEMFPEQKITVTAWNNRLNDLHSLRLVRRVRIGRGLEYSPLTKIILWA